MNYKKLGKIPLADLLLLLQQKAPNLFEEIKPRTHWDGASWDGTKNVSISQALAQRIDHWQVAQEPPQPKLEPYVDLFKEETAELIEREGKRIRDEREASARVEYWKSQGREDNEHNATAITNFLQTSDKLKSVKGRFTPQTVDLDVDFLGAKGSKVLQWRPKVGAPPPPPPQPVRRLSNCEPELPLDANQFQMRRASVEQLRDLDARRRASKPHSSGWHGARVLSFDGEPGIGTESSKVGRLFSLLLGERPPAPPAHIPSFRLPDLH
jgi:hypothetical protein